MPRISSISVVGWAAGDVSEMIDEIVWLEGAQGNRLAATVAGDRNRPCVVLLHGGGQTRYSWKRLVPVLAARDFHVIAYDARGHGDSEWIETGDYRLSDYAADLRVVAASVGRPATLVGASMGGMTALTALDGRGDPVDATALVLVDIVPYANTLGVDRIQTFMLDHADGFGSTDEAAAAIARWRGEALADEQNRRLGQSMRRGTDGRFHWLWDPRILWPAQQRHDPGPADDMARIAASLRLPTLLLRGADSDVVGEAEIANFRTLVPHADIATVPGMAHSVSATALLDRSPLMDFLEAVARTTASRDPRIDLT